jgi:hypothetical protein
MDISNCNDIYEFYNKFGMNRQEAFQFLINELNKLKRGNKNDGRENKNE